MQRIKNKYSNRNQDQRRQGGLQHVSGTRQHDSDLIAFTGFNNDGFKLCDFLEPFDAKLQTCIQQLDDKGKITGDYTLIDRGLRISVEMLKRTPQGRYRRIWLLTDGHPNPPLSVAGIMPVVAEAWKARININTIGFGDASNYNSDLLRQIRDATHNGKFSAVDSLRKLTHVFMKHASPRRGQRYRQHRQPEATVFCIDLSGSMTHSMEGKRKIDVVKEALTRLLAYKQQCFG